MATQQLDRGTVAHNLDGFVSRWRAKIEAMTPQERGQSEKSHAETFWSDLLRQFGIIPERVDLFEPEADRAEHRGSWSPTFERRAERATTGGHGYIDVFWSGMFIGEAKAPQMHDRETHPRVPFRCYGWHYSRATAQAARL